MAREATLIHEVPLPKGTAHGCFVAPAAYEIAGIQVLEREVFGPILHVVRYRADRLDQVLDAIAGTGYGLTLGVHSRIDSTVEQVYRRLPVGNTYVNRNMSSEEHTSELQSLMRSSYAVFCLKQIHKSIY